MLLLTTPMAMIKAVVTNFFVFIIFSPFQFDSFLLKPDLCEPFPLLPDLNENKKTPPLRCLGYTYGLQTELSSLRQYELDQV